MLTSRAMLASRVRALSQRLTFALGLAASACGGDDTPKPAPNVALNYCDVAPILASRCQRCHQSPPTNGAPFSLSTYADTQEATPITAEPGRKRWQDMLKAVENGSMPFLRLPLEPPVSPLSCAEKSTLLTWLEHGAAPAPPGKEDCVSLSPTLLTCED
jgi:hypothetical protein